MFEIKNKSINGQYQFLCDRKLRITWHRQNRKSWSRVRILRHGPTFHLHIIKMWQMKKNTCMHFEEESIIYIWSKFQLDTYMFDSNILLTKFGPGLWSRGPGVGPGFYSFPHRTSQPIEIVLTSHSLLCLLCLIGNGESCKHFELSRHATKPTKYQCAQWRLRSAWASAQSSLPYLIRLHGCPGWSETLLGAQVILLVLSFAGSFISMLAFDWTTLS